MQTQIKTAITFLLACACTGLLTLMAAQSGFQRGGSDMERWLWLSASCLIVCTVHLLPSLMHEKPSLKNLPVWLVWAAGFVFVIFAHAQFFTLAEMHSGQERVAQLSEALLPEPSNVTPQSGNVTGRSVTVIAKELSKATTTLIRLPETKREEQKMVITALERELKIAQEVAEQLASEKRVHTEQISKLQDDPVAHRLATLLGVKHDSVMLVASLFMALTLELIAVVLWKLTLNHPQAHTDSTPVTPIVTQEPSNASLVTQSNETAPQEQATPVTSNVTPASNEASFLKGIPAQVLAVVSTKHSEPNIIDPLSGSTLPAETSTAAITKPVQEAPPANKATGVNDPALPHLLEAVKRGELKPTVSGIRTFARVGTERARMLREVLISNI